MILCQLLIPFSFYSILSLLLLFFFSIESRICACHLRSIFLIFIFFGMVWHGWMGLNDDG